MKKLYFTLLFIGCSFASFSQLQVQAVKLKLKEDELTKFRDELKLVKMFNIKNDGDSYKIETNEGDTTFLKFCNIQFDTINNSLTFKQYMSSYPDEKIEYKITKLNKAKFGVVVTFNEETLKGRGFGIYYCTNHSPKHTCTIKKLKDCKEENGCEF